MRRFISLDSTAYLDPDSVNGLNLYCYCNNDPVNYSDPSGHFAISALIIGAIIGAAVGFGGTVLADYMDDEDIFNGSISAKGYILNTLVGTLIGGFTGGIGSSTFSLTLPTLSLAQTSIGTTALVVGASTVTVNGAYVAVGLLVAGVGLTFARTSKSNGYFGEAWPGDPHKPSHVHLRGNGTDIRIGKDGNPLKGEPNLNAQQKKALEKLWKEFLKLFDKFYS